MLELACELVALCSQLRMLTPPSAHSALRFCPRSSVPLCTPSSPSRQTFLRSRNLPVPRWLDDQANDPAVNEKLQDMLKKAMQTQNQ